MVLFEKIRNFRMIFPFIILFLLTGLSNSILFIIIPAFLSIYIFIIKYQQRKVYLTSPFLFIFFFYLYIFITQFYLTHKIELYHLEGLYRVSSYALLGIIISGLKKSELKLLLNTITLIVLLFTPLGFYEYYIGNRYSFVFPHPNHFAYVLVLLIFFQMILKQKLNLVYIIGLIANLILTKSSGGIITFLLLAFLSSFYVLSKLPFKTRFLALALISGTFFILVSFSDKLITDIITLINFDFSQIEYRGENKIFGGEGSAVWRMSYWHAILRSFFNEDFYTILFGNGIGTTTKGNYIYEFMYTDPHSDFVKFLTELGIIGLWALILFIIYLTRYSKTIFLSITIVLPMLWGNIFVNLPFNFLLICLTFYSLKNEKSVSNI